MKRFTSIITVSILLSVTGLALAQEPAECPSAFDIRDKGTTLLRGYQDSQVNDFLWTFYSAPYAVKSQVWQTIFREEIPLITNPSTAIVAAQDDLNVLAISTYSKSSITSDGVTVCEYTPFKTNYSIYAVDHIDVSLKNLI